MKESATPVENDLVIKQRLERIRKTIVVMSGKGGVGKSTVAVNLATALSMEGYRTGLLDVDIHGPSVPNLLGITGEKLSTFNGNLLPYMHGDNLMVISVGLLLDNNEQPVIYRGPAKMTIIKQFIENVEWGDLDYLIVDCPPGTGDEPLSVIQLMGAVSGAVIVTTPQELALVDVRKSVNFCKTLHVPIIGVIENMSGFVCSGCNKVHDVFNAGGAEKMAQEMGVGFLGKIPLDTRIVETGDRGTSFMYTFENTEAGKSIAAIIARIKEYVNEEKGEAVMRIAIPVEKGNLCPHFGHCEQFVFVDVDEATKTIIKDQTMAPPAHEPGVIPRWVASQGATMVIAGGMGAKAQSLFESQGVKVIVGAPGDSPRALVNAYLNQTLVTGVNCCDH